MLALVTAGVFFAATFLVALMAVGVAWMVLERRSAQLAENRSARGSAADDEASSLLKNESLSTVSVLASFLAQFDFARHLQEHLEQAGLNWTVGRLTSMMLLAGAVGLAVAFNLEWMPLWFGLGLAIFASQAPYLYVRRRRARRLAKFEEQLPDALDFLSRSLRAGHPLGVGLDMLANESPEPLAAEIRRTYEEHQLGRSWEQALSHLSDRVPIVDVGFFAAAVQMQSRTGGKLGEVLGRLSETMRERFALRGEIRSISAHGRFTGLVLTLIPLFVAGVMLVVNPGYLQILLGNPFGKDLVLAAGICLVLAHLIIRRIVDIKF
jgi:tight adherence protein B